MESPKYTCICGKAFVHNPSLYKHRKTCKQFLDSKECKPVNNSEECKPVNNLESNIENINADSALLKQLLIEQEERHQQYVEQQEQRHEQYIEKQEQRHKKYIEELNQKHQLEIEHQEERHQHYIEEQERTHARELEKMEQRLKRLKSEMEDRIEFVKKTMEEQVTFFKNASVTPTSLLPVVPVQTKKAPTIKDYLAEKKPVSIETFISNYIPKAHEYTNILNVGAIDAIAINFSSYLQTYAQEQYPIVISNSQTARLRIYIYTTEWTKYELHDAHKQLNNIILRFVNKYIKHIAVFNEMYPKCMVETPSLHPDCEDDIIKKTRLARSLYQIDDTEAHKIVNQLVNYFIIKKHVEDE